jgi:hypothetical protein
MAADLDSLCRAVYEGDYASVGPLLDLLAEREDWRSSILPQLFGQLVADAVLPRDPQLYNRQDARETFHRDFLHFFWVEILGIARGVAAATSYQPVKSERERHDLKVPGPPPPCPQPAAYLPGKRKKAARRSK